MHRSLRGRRGPRRLIARASVLTLLVLLAVAVVAPTVSGSTTIRRTWRASFGSGAYYGTATLWAYMAGNGLTQQKVRHLRANATYSVRIHSGTCSHLGTAALSLPALVTDATGQASRYLSLSSTQMNAIWKYARTNPIAIRLVSGSSTRCANLSFVVATRIVMSSTSIDLPVVRPPGGTSTFPLCNVAMYVESLSQPGEPGVTMLYAHARTGMFLPLLTQSKINNGAAMLGKYVKVYTSNSKRYLYQVTAVRRHVSSVQSAFSTWTPQIWLQTSEGPYGTSLKLIVVAKLVSVTTTTYAASHPTPHPVVCS